VAKWIKYIGPAHQRVITADNWRSVGLTGDTVVWSAFNGFTVPADSLSEEQVRKAIEHDSQFVIVGEDDDFRPQVQTRDMTPSSLEQTVENPLDVFATVGGTPSGSGATPGGGSDAPSTPTTGTGGGSDTPGTTVH